MTFDELRRASEYLKRYYGCDSILMDFTKIPDGVVVWKLFFKEGGGIEKMGQQVSWKRTDLLELTHPTL